MTDTTTRPATFGEQLSLTSRATRALLDDLLDRRGVPFAIWVVLFRVAASATPVPIQRLRLPLASGLGLDAQAADALFAQMAAAGLIEIAGEELRATPAGEAIYHELQPRITVLTQQVLAGIDPDELETAMRVLVQAQQNAEALRAA